jgi:hypothetical protein
MLELEIGKLLSLYHFFFHIFRKLRHMLQIYKHSPLVKRRDSIKNEMVKNPGTQ